jgi:hypothetical protein
MNELIKRVNKDQFFVMPQAFLYPPPPPVPNWLQYLYNLHQFSMYFTVEQEQTAA